MAEARGYAAAIYKVEFLSSKKGCISASCISEKKDNIERKITAKYQ